MNGSRVTLLHRAPATSPYKGLLATLVAALVVLAGLPVHAGDTLPPPAPAGQFDPSQVQTEHLAPPLLDQMLAPIALYPDALLSQILMASTYPLEVIEAWRWVSEPGNAALKGAALEAALEGQDWDPSVKSLVPFPDVLKIMNDRLAWMQQLGNAFLAQPQDVMDSVQRLRNQAAAAGNLQANEQQQVIREERTIIIQPASTQVVYVPVYDPFVVYGPWAWPDYPPFYFPPFAGYSVHFGLFSWFSFGIVNLYWGWNHFDWHHHHIRIDRDRYHRIWRHREPYPRDHWEHDPRHRRGVAYVDPGLRNKYRPNPLGSPISRIDYRGYLPGQKPVPQTPIPRSDATRTQVPRPATPAIGTSTTPPARTTAPTRREPGEPGRRTEEPGPRIPKPDSSPRGEDATPSPTPSIGSERPGRGETRPDKEPRESREATAPSSRDTAPRESRERVTPAYQETAPRESRERVTPAYQEKQPRESRERATPSYRESTPRVPPAFESYGSGESVRAAVERGRDSRRSSPSKSIGSDRPARAKSDSRRQRSE